MYTRTDAREKPNNNRKNNSNNNRKIDKFRKREREKNSEGSIHPSIHPLMKESWIKWRGEWLRFAPQLTLIIRSVMSAISGAFPVFKCPTIELDHLLHF